MVNQPHQDPVAFGPVDLVPRHHGGPLVAIDSVDGNVDNLQVDLQELLDISMHGVRLMLTGLNIHHVERFAS